MATISHSTEVRLISANATGMPRNGSLVPQRPGPRSIVPPVPDGSVVWLIWPISTRHLIAVLQHKPVVGGGSHINEPVDANVAAVADYRPVGLDERVGFGDGRHGRS